MTKVMTLSLTILSKVKFTITLTASLHVVGATAHVPPPRQSQNSGMSAYPLNF